MTRQHRTRLLTRGAVLAAGALALACPLVVSGTGGVAGAASRGSGLRVQTLLRLPASSAVASAGRSAYTTDDLRDLLVRFNPATGRVQGTVHLSGRPAAMVLAHGDVWVAEAVENDVVAIDTRSLRIVRTVAVPTAPTSLAVAQGDVWVTSVIAGDLTPINPASTTNLFPIPIPAGAVRVAAGFGSLWVTGTSNALTRVSLGASGPPNLSVVTVGNGPIGVATGAGSVWVANAQDGTVTAVNPSTMSVRRTVRVGGDPLSIAVSGGRVYVGDGNAQTVRTIWPSPAPRAQAIGTTPRQLLAVTGGVWVAGSNPGRVLRVTRSR